MPADLQIDATESRLKEVLSRDDQFVVPEYQRLYSWDEEQWDDLWQDLINLEEDETHFLGSIVVIKHGGSFGELNELELVDGQQRLTTISLLLVAMREIYERNDDEEMVEKINREYLHSYDMDNKEYPTLELSETDNDIFRKLVEGQSVDEEDSQLVEALNEFRNNLEGCSYQEADRLRKRLLGSITLVVIDTKNPESAFRLFETLNNRGLELSAVDLMKNSILQEAMEKYSEGSDDEDYVHIREQWEKLLKDVVREISKPNRFFRHYMMSTPEPDIRQSISNYKLYDEFRNTIKNRVPDSDLTLVEYVDGMVDVSNLYLGFTQADVDVFQGRQQQQINDRLENLNAIRSVHSRTLLLRAFQEYEDDFTKLDRLLRLLEVFMTRWKLAGYPSGSRLDSIFSSICSDSFDKENPNDDIKRIFEDEGPSDEEFRVGIISKEFKNNELTKYVLQTMESISFDGASVDWTRLDIEHVVPQRAWDAKKHESWRQKLDITEEEFENYKTKLGNLTILDSSHNAAAGANPFEDKKNYYLNCGYEMTESIREYPEWTMETIEERTEDLAQRAVNVWDYNTY